VFIKDINTTVLQAITAKYKPNLRENRLSRGVSICRGELADCFNPVPSIILKHLSSGD